MRRTGISSHGHLIRARRLTGPEPHGITLSSRSRRLLLVQAVEAPFTLARLSGDHPGPLMRLWMRFASHAASEPKEPSGLRRFVSALADALGRSP